MPIKHPFDSDSFAAYCQDLYRRHKAFDEQQADRLSRHRPLEPESARFLASLIIAKQANKVLEIGTSTGFSTLWLAFALRDNPNAEFVSLEIDEERSAAANQHLTEVGLAQKVNLKVCDAKNFLAKNQQRFDLIFLDAERRFYLDYIESLHSALAISSILVVDNVISHADEVDDFLKIFEQDRRYLCSTLPIGAGLFMATRQSDRLS